ncbi:MAG: response regulator [Gemmataceae bacterium]|nr:response regulator [Gemmataceae bacterium]
MSTSKPVKVLFVDDDPDSRLSFRWIFQAAGFDVEEAATGTEALRLAAGQPDVVVLDVNLPDIDGFEVCRRIKAHPGTRAIPVLHLSGAHISPEAKSHGMEEGADGYLTKPVEPVELIAHVKALARIHQAEEQLREVARQWQTTFDAISDGVCLLDRQGCVLRCNQALARLTGRPAEELPGLPHTALTAPAEAAPGQAGAEATSPFTRMLQTRHREVAELKLGERRLQAVADPLTAADGSIAGAVYILSDITERRRLEEQLRQAQKMEAVGQLAGGVAHDFNNLLTGILGNVSLVLMTLSRDDPNREMLQEAEKLGWRAAELVRQLLGFSRRAPLRLRPTQLGEVIREVVAILRRTIDPRVQVGVRLADSVAVQADAAEMSQVLMNLCLNARDAMPEGGQLVLETTDIELSAEEARGHASRRPGAFVRLRVSDTGHGIAAELLPHIFEPFFTTKGPGKGTGLGLAMVYGILQQHQGWIECDSTPGQGTRFDVYLPRWAESGEALGQGVPAQAIPPRLGGGETILFVDDEAAVRELGREWLTRLGYRVLTAADGQEAVEVFEREMGKIDLVVLDVLMPRLSGTDAVRRLREINPKVRVLFASGFPGDQAVDAVAEGALGFLHKPYGGQQLAAAVRDALDR